MSLNPSADAASPASPTSVPNPLFLPPKPNPLAIQQNPDSSPQTPPSSSTGPTSSLSPLPSPSPADAGPSWSPAADEAPAGQPSGSGDTPSTGNPVTKAGIRTAVGSAVRSVTNLVASIAATAAEQEFGLWRAEEEDVDALAAPASRILYRRLPEEAKGSDTVDLFTLGLALIGYVGKQLHRKAAIRKLLEGGEQIPPPTAPAGP